ncbi:MAG: GNAT family N-acetyltransferase [Micropruina sp.]|uniref:GNAT family N-acetyltransferase n=1 Tax=Micropruina sp. TaxID=2737536 RepID=UPI0039E4FDAB
MIESTPRKLAKADIRDGFRSGADDLDLWLTKYAWENQQANNATTYVVVDGSRVVGYYAIAMSAVARAVVPERLRQARPAQIPCVLLARLAVDRDYQGRGLAWVLLRDALLRSVVASDGIGAAAVLVHCRDENARRFYLHSGDFLESPLDPLQLMVPIKALRRYLTAQIDEAVDAVGQPGDELAELRSIANVRLAEASDEW